MYPTKLSVPILAPNCLLLYFRVKPGAVSGDVKKFLENSEKEQILVMLILISVTKLLAKALVSV